MESDKNKVNEETYNCHLTRDEMKICYDLIGIKLNDYNSPDFAFLDLDSYDRYQRMKTLRNKFYAMLFVVERS